MCCLCVAARVSGLKRSWSEKSRACWRDLSGSEGQSAWRGAARRAHRRVGDWVPLRKRITNVRNLLKKKTKPETTQQKKGVPRRRRSTLDFKASSVFYFAVLISRVSCGMSAGVHVASEAIPASASANPGAPGFLQAQT